MSTDRRHAAPAGRSRSTGGTARQGGGVGARSHWAAWPARAARSRSCPERRQGHGLLRPVRRDRRAGGHPQVRLQGLQTATSTRSSHRSPHRRHSSTASGRRRRPGRATSTSSSACTATSSRSRTRASSAASTTSPSRSRPCPRRWSRSGSSGTKHAVLRPALAGDVRDGRQQGRAQVHAEGRRHQRAHLRAGVRSGRRRSARARARTGSGFPRATPACIHRFLQGFLVPSFTGGFVTGFRSKEAVRGVGRTCGSSGSTPIRSR